MPYINDDMREEVDGDISNILEYVDSVKKDGNKIDGLINYIITKIVVESFKPLSYSTGSDMIKTLECSKLEIYRRLLSPYENNAVERNGDLACFVI